MSSASPTQSTERTQVEPLLVVDDFLPQELAAAMRADIDAHFATPYNQRPQTHQVWNFWYVVGLYTYLRTQPEKVIARASMERFASLLREWSIRTLGLATIGSPFLSFYTSGCRQSLHNDSRNGRFAFVYSLTRNERRTIGGQTIVFRGGDPFLRNLRHSNAGEGLYQLVEPRFNRLVVFDDRMVHGVQLIEGSMDPLEGRFVLHGHIEESPPIVQGALPAEEVSRAVRHALERFYQECYPIALDYHGPLVLRFAIAPEGRIVRLRVVLDRVFCEREGNDGWERVRGQLIELLRGVTFPATPAETGVTLPLLLGGPVRVPRANPPAP